MQDNKNRIIAKVISVVSALCLWHILSLLIDSEILLVSPIVVLKRFFEFSFEKDFYLTIGFTFKRIVIGFLTGSIFGIVLAVLAGRFRIIEIFLWPYMVTIKSIPVASFVVIALIWLSGSSLSVFISFLMALPIIYTNILEGIKSTDKKMLEMAEVFKIPFLRRLRFIWLPAVKPFLLSGIRVSIGLSWKSGIAAELIGYPQGSIGEALYYAKLYLATSDLLAWTLSIVLLSVAFEKLFLLILKMCLKGAERI